MKIKTKKLYKKMNTFLKAVFALFSFLGGLLLGLESIFGIILLPILIFYIIYAVIKQNKKNI